MLMHRRRFVQAGLALPLAASLPQGALALTPECRGKAAATPRQTEGPFYTSKTPLRASLVESGAGGTRIEIVGLVLSPACRPVAKAMLDFWQADERGDYDNSGFKYRGHQFTDAEGRYRLETIVPAVYPGRTRHIHVKVQAPGGRILTTQVYFAGEPGNARDGLFLPELLLRPEGKALRFDFVVEA
jgi:protocatechuate 3,4-dioxygenase beta subunit